MIPIQNILNSTDPLADENIESLLNHFEEDIFLDYKEQFNIDGEKDWLSITKDIMAFANAHGGFLVFGIRDITFELIGLNDKCAKFLSDVNNILQKINRYIEPQITNVRSKKIIKSGVNIVIVYIPSSQNITHMFLKDGSFLYPTKVEKIEFRKGTFIVRRSGGNHLADSRDLDFIFNNRLKYFKESILDRFAKVVEAPLESKIFVVSEQDDTEGVKKFRIDDSSDALPLKGMSFSIVPSTIEEEIAGWIALNKRDSRSIPHKNTLWEWYFKRDSIKLNSENRCYVSKFCILSDVPFFYWLKDCNAEQVFSMLIDSINYDGSFVHYNNIILVANFLSIKKFNIILQKMGKKADRISPGRKRYLKDDKLSLVSMGKLGYRNVKKSGETEVLYKQRLIVELNEIVESKIKENPRIQNDNYLEEAIAYDCFLYSSRNNYSISSS